MKNNFDIKTTVNLNKELLRMVEYMMNMKLMSKSEAIRRCIITAYKLETEEKVGFIDE